jgi:hypothetical protein
LEGVEICLLELGGWQAVNETGETQEAIYSEQYAPSGLRIKNSCLFIIDGIEKVRQSLCRFDFGCLP